MSDKPICKHAKPTTFKCELSDVGWRTCDGRGLKDVPGNNGFGYAYPCEEYAEDNELSRLRAENEELRKQARPVQFPSDEEILNALPCANGKGCKISKVHGCVGCTRKAIKKLMGGGEG